MLRTATEEEIRQGKVTDIYFERTEQILKAKKINKSVQAEFTVNAFPDKIPWAVFSGLSDVVDLMADKPVDIEAIPEGTVFTPGLPVMTISGKYLDFGIYETTILGLICHASGIATQAARIVRAAEGRTVLSFGTRRMHPAIAPIIDRNAYIGGCNGLSTKLSGEILQIPASGTIPHALVLLMGGTVEAVKAFDKIIEKKVPRIALIDTFNDEQFEAVNVAKSLKGKLYGIRLDTPASRRGNFLQLMREVRWELDIRGFKKVKIFASGGLKVDDIVELNEVVDAYGVGNAISNAPVLDFSMDIVEINGKPVAKRGKKSGHKVVLKGRQPFEYNAVLASTKPPRTRLVTKTYLEKGKPVAKLPTDNAIRNFVLKQISDLPLYK
ncbi:MAG TPA: nicotinate phosphoribosyltransferase [Candidatus Marinimicrobia bacterium]|nr:nicotinate phosphoribosyltransferase [Candidatus Neomarinimicrobiota bacterium]